MMRLILTLLLSLCLGLMAKDKEETPLQAPKDKKAMQTMLSRKKWNFSIGGKVQHKMRFIKGGKFSPSKGLEYSTNRFIKWDIDKHGKDGQAVRLQMWLKDPAKKKYSKDTTGFWTFLWNKELQAWTHHGKTDSKMAIILVKKKK